MNINTISRERMTGPELHDAMRKVYKGMRWRAKLAEALCVDRCTVTRWSVGERDVPVLASIVIRAMVEQAK